MKLDLLYPYWTPAHEDLVEKLRFISDEQWNAMPAGESNVSIRLLVYRFIQFERLWMHKIAQGRELEPLPVSDFKCREDYISEFEAERARTIVYLDSLPVEALRAVRVAPADPATNDVERNVPLSWIVWRVLEEELMTYGQVRPLIEMTSARIPGIKR